METSTAIASMTAEDAFKALREKLPPEQAEAAIAALSSSPIANTDCHDMDRLREKYQELIPEDLNDAIYSRNCITYADLIIALMKWAADRWKEDHDG